MTANGEARIGCSGYEYDHWKGTFYPEDLPKEHWLDFYQSRFNTVEINNSFYQIPCADAVAEWCNAAKPGFRYAMKLSRYATHMKKLKDPEEPLQTFLEPVERLGARLGPVLAQLPPRWKPDPERLRAFLKAAPARLRWAVEVRDPDWLCDAVVETLEEFDAALVVHDMIENHPRRFTAPWSYWRFHGDHYEGSYTPQFLAARADEIAELIRDGRDVYVYFNNDAHGCAPRNAAQMKDYVERRL